MLEKLFAAARKIFGGIFLFLAVVMICTNLAIPQPNTDMTSVWVCTVLILLLGLFLLFKKGKSKAEKDAKKAQKAEARDRVFRTVTAEHMSGLPLAQGTPFTLFFQEDSVSFSGGGHQFDLAYDKIFSMDVKSEVEVRTSYVSSAGGAALGEALFGPLGAAVGGRVQEKTTRSAKYFFIFTYKKDDQPNYIIFKVYAYDQASKLVERYKPKIIQDTRSVIL